MADDTTTLEDELTPLMRAFVEEYLVDDNAGAAYKRAGGSARSARQSGPELLKDPRIKALIKQRMVERETETRVRGYRVLDELAIVAFSDHEHYRVDARGKIRLTGDAPKGAMRAISRVRRKVRVIPQGDKKEPIVEYDVEFSLWPKTVALTDAMRKLGMFVDVTEIRTPAGSGVLAVPVPVTAEQWQAAAVAQQTELAKRPSLAAEPTGT